MLLTPSTRRTWSVELRRAVLSWRAALLATALAVHLSVQIDHLKHVSSIQPGALGALAVALNRATPDLALALAAGAFAAFGLVEDFAYGRLGYARRRAGSTRTYMSARTLAPAIGMAGAVVLACVIGEGFAFLRFPPQPLTWRLERGGQPWPLFEIGPLTADLAVTGLVALAVAALTVLAGVIARTGRRLATLLAPPAFLVIGSVLGRGPLTLLSPTGRMSSENLPELVTDLIYWLALGGLALAAALVLARPTPGRTDA